MRFELSHTHAYPGCRVRTEPARPPRSHGEAVIGFSDGNVLVGRYARDGDTVVLAVPAHRTARGTSIVAKRWRLGHVGGDGWKVLKRLPDGDDETASG